jgi:hypothetical protein
MITNQAMLPYELVEKIIDDLLMDKYALEICSLVHRSWTARCRQHLFHTVMIHDEQESKRFADSMREFPQRILLTREAHLLDGPWRKRGPVWFYGGYGLARLVPILKDIQVLRLQFLDFSKLSPSVREIMSNVRSPAFPHVQRLTLIRCSFFAYPSFIGFVCALSSLLHLSLTGPHWAHPADDVPELDLPLLRLRSLTLNQLRLSPFPPAAATTLAHRIDPNMLETLDVCVESSADHHFFENLTTILGPYVQYLRLRCDIRLLKGRSHSLNHVSTFLTSVLYADTLPAVEHLTDLSTFSFHALAPSPGVKNIQLLKLFNDATRASRSGKLRSMSFAFNFVHPSVTMDFPESMCMEFTANVGRLVNGARSFHMDIVFSD